MATLELDILGSVPGLSLQPRYLNEALLLLAKVHYVQGHYRDAQGMCARAGIEEFTRDEQPIYHLRLLAEAFVIKGTNHSEMTNEFAFRAQVLLALRDGILTQS